MQKNSTIVIGLSGGPDSVFLLYFLKEITQDYNLNLIAAHLDHEWRNESYKDADFCATIAKRLNIPCTIKKMSELDVPFKMKGSKEELGRRARRFFFEQVAQKYNAQSIALGHHLNDQEETFFIRLIRGTTLSGLSAMRPKAGLYIRPLLETSKKEILQYLNDNELEYVVDLTNIQESYLRNRIRKNVIPALQECDERFDQNFLRTLYTLQNADDFLHKITEQTFDTISHRTNTILEINSELLFKQDPYLQNRLLIFWLIKEKVPFVPTEKFLEEIKRFLIQPHSKEHHIHQHWSLIKKKNYVAIKKNTQN